MGDFHYWDTFTGCDELTFQLCDVSFDLNLFQYVDKPTHVHGSMLDDCLFSQKAADPNHVGT